MARNDRLRIIREIEGTRNSRVLSYLTGDRRGLEARIASDVFTLVYAHLRTIGHVDRLDLFLYSTGGVTIAAWGLVNVLRQFCDHLSVLIPFKAHSAATLIALGADEIVMGELAQLSPVDPSVTSPYNPAAPGQQQPGATPVLPVSVEDVVAFIDLAKEEAKLTDPEALAQVFRILSEKVHPLALGGVYRARQQIRMLAKKLLSFHTSSKNTIDTVVNTLTKELYSHDYLISRKEAKRIKLKVTDPNPELEGRMWDLYSEYDQLLQTNTPYQPEVLLAQQNAATAVFTRGLIESTSRTDAFETEKEITRIQATQPGLPFPIQGFQERVLREGWATGVNY